MSLPALVEVAWAKEPVDPGAPRAEIVQDRRFGQTHEVSGWFGVLPMDAFTKGVTLTGGYTWHPSNLWGWEVAQVTGSFGIDTRLADELAALPQPVGPTPFETVQLYGTSNLVFKPIYGKLALMNRRVVWCEAFLVAGGGVGRLTNTTRPVADIGLGTRVYAGDRASLRLDVRQLWFFQGASAQGELWVALGLGVDLGTKERR
jgi:outer membrane beta-barrel protein